VFGTVLLLAFAHPAPAQAAAGHGCHPLVVSATWSAGRLSIAPSACGRRVAAKRPRRVFRAAIAAGGQGAPNRRSLYRQFECHVLFAPSKPRWNLEAWRPLVPWVQMVLTGCNPPASG
jgi:hypothetical protein